MKNLAVCILFLFILGKIYAIGTADVLFLPWRPFNAAMGGQATHSLPIESSAATNAAYLGYGQQNSFFLGFLWGNAFTGFFLDTALFSPYGGLGIGADYFKADDQTAAVRFSYGSFLSKHVGTGLTVTPRYTSAGKDQAFGFGIDPSLIIDSKWYKSMIGNDGLGIYSPAFSLTTRNLAIPLGESNLLPLSAVHIGLTTGTYQSSAFNAAFAVSTYGSDKFDRVPLLLGVQSQYRWFLFSLGYSAHNTISIHDGFRMGVGAAEHFTFGDAFLFYNLNIAKENNTATHGIVASVRLGGIDSDPPEITFTPDGNSFSPNDDGVRDLLIFNATVSDKSPVVYYELRIHDANGKMVYQLKSDERLREKSFSFALFFRSFLAPRARADIPEQFTWNGRVFSDASKKVKDTVFEDEPQVEKLPDGTYHYEFWVLDEKNNESKHATGAIIIDTKKPIASVELDSDLISPNGDGQRDILTITQEVTTDDSYEAFVLATNGEKVRRYAWKNNAPTRVEFDGKKDNGDLLAEGVYRYQLVGYNAAGNRNEAMSGNFYVSRRVDTVFLKSSNVGLNPLQKSFAEVVLSPSVTYSEGYKEGAIFIRKDCESKKEEDILFQLPVTTLEESATAKNKKSKKNKSALYVWRGESKDGKRLPDGVYCLSFRAHYENGNTPVSPPVQIVLDTTGPELDVVADLEVRQFSPDGDGENEEQVFRLSSDDLTGIDSYALTIEEVVITDKETKYLPVRRFEGKGIMPRSIYWDGRTESGALVESLTQYQYTLSAVDNYGNTSTTQGRRFETGVLVTPRVNGFFIRLPQVQLDNLTGDTARLLLSTLNKYAKYKIKLEVHTTPSRGIETGLRRTEKAARALYGYFVDKGIAPDRLSYQGFGDTAPVYRGAVAVKNNRVDVYLSR